jgi:REP element-mobilizing transposase RayT
MKDWKSLSHVRWDCKYHLVFISKYRQRKIYGEVRRKIKGTGTKYFSTATVFQPSSTPQPVWHFP